MATEFHKNTRTLCPLNLFYFLPSVYWPLNKFYMCLFCFCSPLWYLQHLQHCLVLLNKWMNEWIRDIQSRKNELESSGEFHGEEDRSRIWKKGGFVEKKRSRQGEGLGNSMKFRWYTLGTGFVGKLLWLEQRGPLKWPSHIQGVTHNL